jgi:hypothetical protein
MEPSSYLSVAVRKLLEDFEVATAGQLGHLALIPNYPAGINVNLYENVQAAVLASLLDIRSIDYAKKKYYHARPKTSKRNQSARSKYIAAYKSAKEQIEEEIAKVNGEPESLGIFGASIVLRRLVSSFFSAHLLYSLGHEYEAHAISRLILEQIAWAYTAYPFDDIRYIKRIAPTKAITGLQKVAPDSGRLYGFLSKKTHIDYDSHSEFIDIQGGMILLSQDQYYDYANIILTLADLFCIIWEITQFDFMSGQEFVEKKGTAFVIKQNRPFLKIIRKHLNAMKKTGNEQLRQTGLKKL